MTVSSQALPSRITVVPGFTGGVVRVPGDKSLSHRALLLGAMSGGPVDVRGLAPSGDVRSSAAALRIMGVDVELQPGPHGMLEGVVVGAPREAGDVLDCGNSGTTLRLLSGLTAGVDGLSVLTGDASLRRRPVDRVVAPLRALGVDVSARDGDRLPPLVVRGGNVRGDVTFTSPVASAQVKSCVLLAGLRADGPVTVRSPLASRDHTERMLRAMGASVATAVGDDGEEVVTVQPGPLTPCPIDVAGDPSSATFWLVAGAIAGVHVRIEHCNLNPGRTGAASILRDLGADVEETVEHDLAGEPTGSIDLRPGELAGGAVVSGRTVVDAIDELPVLALAGAASRDGLDVRDAGELRVKESDRIAAVGALCRSLGLEVDERPDGFRVPGGQHPQGGQITVIGDHRIAMTAAIAGLIGDGPVQIDGFDSVASSYPTFLEDLAQLGGHAQESPT